MLFPFVFVLVFSHVLLVFAAMPLAFSSDVWPILIMFLFALSNGFLSAHIMMYGPTRVKGKAAETAGAIMVSGVMSGLISGSFLSFGFTRLVDHS